MSHAEPNDTPSLDSFGTAINAVVVGASGGLGQAFVVGLTRCPTVSQVVRLSRSQPKGGTGAWYPIELESEDSIVEAASAIKDSLGTLHLVIVATGVLHAGDGLQPEKSWRALSAGAMETAFRLNTTGPALIAKHLLPLLARDRKAAFAALSARVGSIEDNQLGGWYAYRASKAALNMVIKTLAIELARRHPLALCVGLHPGTVDTALSKPFQSGVPQERLFWPDQSAQHLLAVLDRLAPEDSGHLYAWDGRRIPF